MAYNIEGQTNCGKRNGKNILEGVGGGTANYKASERIGIPSMKAADEREKRQSKAWAKNWRRARRKAVLASVPKVLTEAEAARNTKYWQAVSKGLAKGLSLADAKARVKIKPITNQSKFNGGTE